MSFKALSWAWEANTGSPGRKLVLVGLAQFANEKNECWPSQKTLAERTEQSDRTVREHLAWLEDKGFVSRRPRVAAGKQYETDLIQLHLDRINPIEEANKERSPAEDFAAGDQGQASGEKPHEPAEDFAETQRKNLPPNLHMNLQVESPDNPPTPQGGRTRVRKSFDPTEFDDKIPLHFRVPSFLNAWHDWMSERHERRNGLTERAAELQIRKLLNEAKTPEDAAKWILGSIENGWSGVFKPKDDALRKGPKPGPAFRTTADTSLAEQLERRNHAPDRPNAGLVDPGW